MLSEDLRPGDLMIAVYETWASIFLEIKLDDDFLHYASSVLWRDEIHETVIAPCGIIYHRTALRTARVKHKIVRCGREIFCPKTG